MAALQASIDRTKPKAAKSREKLKKSSSAKLIDSNRMSHYLFGELHAIMVEKR